MHSLIHMTRQALSWCLVPALAGGLCCLSSCGTSNGNTEKTWTVFVYGHGDHNLSNSLLADMVEMGKANLGDKVTVIVAADWNSSLEARGTISDTVVNGSHFPVGLEWYKITGDGKAPAKLSTQSERNLDSPSVMRAAVKKAFTDYPADRYAVVMWDHGGSWISGFGGDTANGTVSGEGILPPVIASSIQGGLTDAGINQPLEFLGFDTCLMMGAEVAHEFRTIAKTYIACAEIDFGNGWDYTATLNSISTHNQETAQKIATQEVAAWAAHHSGEGISAEEDFVKAHAAIDLTQWAAFEAAFQALWDAMDASSSLDWAQVARAGYVATPGYWNPITDGADQPVLRDMGQFLTALGQLDSDSAVTTAAKKARTAFSAMFLGTSLGLLRSAAEQSGMHTEFSLASDYKSNNPIRLQVYQDTNWAKDSGSGDLLQALVDKSDDVGPLPVTEITQGTAAINIKWTVTDTDVAETQLMLFQDAGNDNLLTFGEIGESITMPGEQNSYDWQRTAPSLTDGSASSFGFTMRWISSASATIYAMPGTLNDGYATYDASILFSDDDSETTQIIITDENDRSVVYTLAPGWVFTPSLLNYNSTTEEWSAIPQTALTVPDTGVLNVESSALSEGQYILGTTAIDVWGNSDVAVDTIAISTSG